MEVFYLVVFVCGLVLAIEFFAMWALNNAVTTSGPFTVSPPGRLVIILTLAVVVAGGLLAAVQVPEQLYSGVGYILYPFVWAVQKIANAVGIDRPLLEALGDTEYAGWVRESLYGWATALTFHAFGNAIVIGLTFIIGLRLIGMFRSISYAAMVRLFPVIWFGVLIQVLSGFSLWMTKPARYTGDSMFDTKFTMVIIGIIVTICFERVIRREAAAWDSAGAVSARGLRWAGFAAIAWSGVLVGGRLTAYLGTLYMQ
jgi:hypothetical protein